MIAPSDETWRAFGLAVVLALVEANQDAVVEKVLEVSAEQLFLMEGKGAAFGFPLACGRLPVAVRGLVCLCSRAEVERYYAEFVTLPGAV